ncbi:hypothetical protein RJ639_026305 [Escallonia herrerae]|uniref:Uncharacterized protein n=1 Tax=Escallonia herrerae TaxID=1293975 RepID=A0AA89ABZ2_9ASTE|nr:hypothetical protein RJ639_026305 [Escallonia herrerae]
MSETSTSASTSEEDIVVSSSSSSSSEWVPTSGSEVEWVPTSGSEVGTSNPQPPQPSTSQPSHSLPAKNALGDVKDQAEDKANPKPWYTTDEKSSKMSTEALLELIREYPLPEGWYARLPSLQEPANYETKFETGIYEEQVKSEYRLHLHPFALRFFEHYHMAPGQLVPNGWTKLVGHKYLVQTSGYKPDATDFMRVFFKICFVKGVANYPGWYYIHSRQRLLKGGPKLNKGWHSRYFFMGRMDKGRLPFDRDWNPYYSQILEQHLVHRVLPRDKEVFQNQTHETVACSFAQAVYTKRTDDGLEIYEMGFMKANEMFAERFPDIPLGDSVMPAIVSPSEETTMPLEARDDAASHPPGEGPSGDPPSLKFCLCI